MLVWEYNYAWKLDMLDQRAVHIHTDGSCYKNPGGKSGCAATAHFPDSLKRHHENIVDFGCAESSNNRMELMACIKSLEWVREHKPWPDVTRVQVVTDSLYVTENLGRADSWKRNKWRNRHGMPVANDDLWNRLLAARQKAGIRVDFAWQPGKKSDISRIVDTAAKAAAKRGGIDKDRDYRPGAVSRSKVRGGVAQSYPAQGQVAAIWPYAKKIMFRGESRISFNIFDETTQEFRMKYYAFTTPLKAAELHRNHVHRVRFNAEPQYPQIVERIGGVAVAHGLESGE